MPEQTADQYSTWVGLIYVFNLIVGTGALTLPAAFSKAGWALGLFVILILGFISFVTVTFVIEAMASANAILTWQRIQDRKKASGESVPSNSDSEDTPLVGQINSTPERTPDNSYRYYLINEKIEMGEMASLFFSKFGLSLFYICLVVYLYGDLSIYAAAIGKSVEDVACTYQPANFTCNDTIPDDSFCWDGSEVTRLDAYRIFLTTFIMILGPFAFFNVQKTKYLQLVTSVMRWSAFGIMICYAMRILVLEGAQNSPPTVNLPGIPGLFGACVYSFMCHHSLPGLIAPISNKSTLKRSLFLDYVAIASFYVLLALTGAFAFKHIDDLYTLDFGPRGAGDCTPNSNVFLTIIEYFLALFPVFTLTTSFPIIAITLRNNLQALFIGKQRDTTNATNTTSFCLKTIAFPILAVLPPYIIAMITKDLSILVGITGSYAGTGIQYLIPTFLVYNARKKSRNIIGLGVRNKFASPFASHYWLIFVGIWALTCMIIVTVNLCDIHSAA